MTVGMTRREVLAAFLGVPVALAACKSNPNRALPPGEIVGASDVVGHRLRDGARVTPSEDHWRNVDLVIVGGGVAGLSAAWRLAKAGIEDFVLIELERRAGGTSRSGESPLVPYPWGAHYLPTPTKENPDLVALLDEMGLLEGRDSEGQPVVGEQFLCRDPEERIYYRGEWFEGLYMHAGASLDDEAQLERFNREIDRWVAWRDSRGRRAFTIPVARCSDDAEVAELDSLSMADWMDRNVFTSPRLRWLVDYACRDDYGLRATETSAWAGLFYFASRMRNPGDETQPLITWPEGNGRLVSHLLRPISDKCLLGFTAVEIVPSVSDQTSLIHVVALNYDGDEALGFRARRVIFAAPHFLTRYVIRPYRDDPPSHVADFDYSAWMVANLFLTDRPEGRGFPLAWDNVIYDSPSLGYVAATHQLGIDHGPTVFTYYFPLCDQSPLEARRRLLAADRTDWAEVALADLNRAHNNIRPLTERLDVMRWGHAMIRPTPGFIWSDSRRRAARPYRGIHFANTDLSGIPLFEEAFFHGLRAADEVVAALRHRET